MKHPISSDPLTTATALPLPQRPLHPLRRQPRRRASRPQLPPRLGSDQESRHHRARLPSSRRNRQLCACRQPFPASLLGITGPGPARSTWVLGEEVKTSRIVVIAGRYIDGLLRCKNRALVVQSIVNMNKPFRTSCCLHHQSH